MPVKAQPRRRRQADAVRERVRAWWSEVVVGQHDQSHPVFGNNIRVKLDGDTVQVRGRVANAQDLRELRKELDELRGSGISDYKLAVEVKPPETGKKGLLEQDLVAVYESAEQAKFAARYIEHNFDVHPKRIEIVRPANRTGNERLRTRLGAYWEQARTALRERKTLVICTVDEVEAFRAREQLDEETRSTMTFALAPRPRSHHA